MKATKRALICGAGGFIGWHLTNRLRSEGYWVRGIDLKENEYGKINSDEFIIGDLRDPLTAIKVTEGIDEVYQLAADMGGAAYIFTGDNDAQVMHNSSLCNINILNACQHSGLKKIFYSSSACIYPEHNQLDNKNPRCDEASAYPAAPDSEYGWEKLFSERLYLAYSRNYGIDIRIARFHNIFGPMGTWNGGKEKAPAAICRKVIKAPEGGEIEIWGDGKQTRSFLYIEDCLEGIIRLMNSSFSGPVNIGSEEMISINDLAALAIKISGKQITIKNIPGPTGVRGRNSDNVLIRKELGWSPTSSLKEGIEKTYYWINEQYGRYKKTSNY